MKAPVAFHAAPWVRVEVAARHLGRCHDCSVDHTDREISTVALTASDVPSSEGPLDQRPDGTLPSIWQFALTYRPTPALPYKLHEFVAQSARTSWETQQELPDIGLDGLRLALWWEYQHWRHGQSGGGSERKDPSHAAFARALVKKIHLVLFQEESWWWDPGHKPTEEERAYRAKFRSPEGHDIADLYDIAARLLAEAIDQREAGADDPLNLALMELDSLRLVRMMAGHRLARGLVDEMGGRTLEEARAAAYAQAGSIRP